MPDENKLKSLVEANYNIPICCGLCKHARFEEHISGWGTCKKIKYKHLKHTGEEREASIHEYGSCPNAELDTSVDFLHGHRIFLNQ